MKRNHFFRLALLTVALVAATAACAVDEDAPIAVMDVPTVQPAGTYDGEAMFRGLFFGQGEVAEQFPEIWDGHPEVASEEALALSQNVIAWIATNDPTFFGRFETALRSGRHLDIARGLDEAGLKLKAGLSASLGEDVDALIKDSATDKPGDSVGTCVLVWVVAVVAGNVAAVVNAVYAANVAYEVNWLWSEEKLRDMNPEDVELQREMMTDLIANRLASSSR